MADRPHLVLPPPEIVGKNSPRMIPPRPRLPTRQYQARRFDQDFQDLRAALEAKRARLQADPTAAEPEELLVFETFGTPENFWKAVAKTEGLEWLLEYAGDDLEPDPEGFHFEKKPEKTSPGFLYLVLSNQKGIERILSFWGIYKRGERLPRGFAPWRQLFTLLHDVRRWGPQDRLHRTGLLEDWEERRRAGEEDVPIVVELTFRRDQEDRRRAEESIRSKIEEAEGQVLASTTIEEIRYHAILGRVPISSTDGILQANEASLVMSSSVMFLRPQSRADIMPVESEPAGTAPEVEEPIETSDQPLVALLDGLPIQNHRFLAGRLLVDDPDQVEEAGYPVTRRIHGTGMASLISHGDLSDSEGPLPIRIYVRPILRAAPDWLTGVAETMPSSELPVDSVHRALRRMFEGDGAEPPVAPSVRYVNLCVCDEARPFERIISPWARLIDWWSATYQVLFLVSAGNQGGRLRLPLDTNEPAEIRTRQEECTSAVLKTLAENPHDRRILSPAESINALTVGAAHSDGSTGQAVARQVDPMGAGPWPSPISRQGPGVRRAVKPDLLLPGGRQLFIVRPSVKAPPVELEPVLTSRPPGALTAAPGRAGDVDAVSYCRGTSVATALATRRAFMLHRMLVSMRDEAGGDRLDPRIFPLLTKALLIHGSDRAGIDEHPAVGELLPDTVERKKVLDRLVGHGPLQWERVSGSTGSRATLLGASWIEKDEGHRYRIPLPTSLSGFTDWRRLTVTLAWFSSVNPSSQKYRVASLTCEPYGTIGKDENGERFRDGDAKEILHVDRMGAERNATRRGTVQHDVYDGARRAVDFASGGQIHLQVNAREECACPANSWPVPYALAVTLEVAAELALPIYDEIRARIIVPVGAP